MLQQPEPDDYVLATGETHSVREFVERAFACVGRRIAWRGEGVDEVGIDEKPARRWCRSIRATSARPRSTCCSAIRPRRKAKLGWEAKTTFDELVAEMVESDLKAIEREAWRDDRTAR